MTERAPNDYDEISALMRAAIEGFAKCLPEFVRISNDIKKATQGLTSPAVQRCIKGRFATTPTPEAST